MLEPGLEELLCQWYLSCVSVCRTVASGMRIATLNISACYQHTIVGLLGEKHTTAGEVVDF
jgi:hypothetical protein